MPNVRSEICEITLKEIVGNLSNKPASKIVHEWNCHLEIFSRAQVIENSSNICFFKQIFCRKQSFGVPDNMQQ